MKNEDELSNWAVAYKPVNINLLLIIYIYNIKILLLIL